MSSSQIAPKKCGCSFELYPLAVSTVYAFASAGLQPLGYTACSCSPRRQPDLRHLPVPTSTPLCHHLNSYITSILHVPQQD